MTEICLINEELVIYWFCHVTCEFSPVRLKIMLNYFVETKTIFDILFAYTIDYECSRTSHQHITSVQRNNALSNNYASKRRISRLLQVFIPEYQLNSNSIRIVRMNCNHSSEDHFSATVRHVLRYQDCSDKLSKNCRNKDGNTIIRLGILFIEIHRYI